LRGRHLLVLDTVAVAAAICLAFVLRSDRLEGFGALGQYYAIALLPLFVRGPVNIGLGLYERLWRYASVPDLTQVLYAGALGSIISVTIFYLLITPFGPPGIENFPISFWVLEGMLSVAALGGLRFAIRAAGETRVSGPSITTTRAVRTLLYGAGQAGVMMARAAKQEPRAGLLPIGFLDDFPALRGQRVAGLPVFGGLETLRHAVAETGAKVLLITMPSAPGRAVRRVTEMAMTLGLDVRTVPPVHELLDGSIDAFRVRRVRVEDLIRRPEVTKLGPEVEAIIRDRVVFVTGAGGSIGSELARQVYAMGPRCLVLVDRAESALYSIQRELEVRAMAGRGSGEVEIHLANVASRAVIRRLVETTQPHVIFHAAAYKHVPLMEAHPSDAVQVNIGGTLAVLDAAAGAGTPYVVLVSSDKAVAPSSVMGATKRVAEWLVGEAARLTDRVYVSVRFGNVLGSTGSVVPIFQRQLENAEPMTVTHPEMTRYFMTIAEASSLILEAAALGRPGDLFVLDMGEPVRIVDLARDLARLAGRDPDTVPIVFTGLRPGEKLHEQLYYDDELARPTRNEKVMRAVGDPPPMDAQHLAKELLLLADGDHDDLLRARLSAVVSGALIIDPPRSSDRADPATAVPRAAPEVASRT
jgi:FlaA1/EpsC-like NDP-sugar epimerase